MTAILALLEKSLFMWPLLACSVATVALTIHRAISLRANSVMPRALIDALETNAPLPKLDDSTLARISQAGLVAPHGSRQAAMDATEAKAREEILSLQTGLTTLEMIVTIAPLLGLLGTVSGLVTVFSGLGDGASPNTGGVARGISEALNTTIAGLAVAVPTVVVHGHFQRKIERLAARMQVLLQHALEQRYPR